MALPQYVKESQILRRIAADPHCRFRWTKHALEEIAKDGRTTRDIEFSLTNCQVTLEEWKKDRLWRTIGRGIDGEIIEAVVAVYEEEVVIKVVTAF